MIYIDKQEEPEWLAEFKKMSILNLDIQAHM